MCLALALGNFQSLSAAPVTLAAFGHRVIAPGLSAGYSNGDTWDGAWGLNGTLFLQHDDGTGFNKGANVHDRLCQLQGTPEIPSTLFGVDLNPGILGDSLKGSPCYSTGIYEVDGVLYHNVCYSRQIPGAWVFHHTSILKSLDGGRNWMNHLGAMNSMPPDDINRSFFPSEDWGQVNFVKYGRGGMALAVDNAQTYVYFTASWGALRLARMARTNLPMLDRAKMQFYAGGDGLLDSSWTNDIKSGKPIPVPSSSPTAVVFNAALGRYLMTSFTSDSWQQPPIESTLRIMEAPHPWGPWTLVLDENVNQFEGDNLTWAFLLPKFTSRSGKKMWMSVAGRAPYGLQLIPIYLSTNSVVTQEAEDASMTDGAEANSKSGFSGRGYVSLDAVGKKCEFTFKMAAAGTYIVNFRYNTEGYGRFGLGVNGKERARVELGKSEQPYATWTEMSILARFDIGTNRLRLECEDNVGKINLDRLSIALWSTDDPDDRKDFAEFSLQEKLP